MESRQRVARRWDERAKPRDTLHRGHDPAARAEVLSVIADLAKGGQTMLVVTHSMSFARSVATTVHVFADGHDVEFGAPDALFEDPQHAITKSFLREASRG